MKRISILLVLAAVITGCSAKVPAVSEPLAAPSGIQVERTGRTSVRVQWQDNSQEETGFAVWLRPTDNLTRQDRIGQTAADITTFDIGEGLAEGKSYYFGIQAIGRTEELSSKVEYVLFNLVSLDNVPVITIEESKATDCSIALRYRFSNHTRLTDVRYGLCWSTDGEPSLAGNHQEGPGMTEASESLLQVLPNVVLEIGKPCTVAVYLTSSTGTWYSEPVTLQPVTAPQPITLTWTETDAFDGVTVRETTSKVNGRNFHAWYAEADPARVDFRVLLPSAAATIDQQRAAQGDGCLILTNGGYFYNGRHTGLAVHEGKPSGTISSVRGSLRPEDEEYQVMYPVTRGVFGVDAAGKAAVLWAGSPSTGEPLYFDRPLPSVRGEARYPGVDGTHPSQAVSWMPAEALSAGPVLLFDGRIPFNFDLGRQGGEYYLNNFEIMPYDIFGPEVICDRTAAGYTADGRIILFVCDGRIDASPGLNLLELACILQGLGCTHAVNFDGGGSTGMMVKDRHVNDVSPNNRPVVSTMGFFKKQN